MKTARDCPHLFEAQIFLENPEQIRRETTLGEDLFPGGQRFLQGWTRKRGGDSHEDSLSTTFQKPIHKFREALLDLDARLIAEPGARLGNVRECDGHVTGLHRLAVNHGLFTE